MIRKRGNAWTIVVYAGVDERTGRERRVSETFKGSKKDAEDRERQLVLDVRAGRVTAGGGTVKQLLEAWLEQAGPDLAATTVYNYRRIIDTKIVPELGRLPVAKLTTARLDRYYTDLRVDLSPKTVRNVHAILRRALAQAQRWGWISTNPAALASPPKTTKPDIRPPGRADLAAFLATLLTSDADFGMLVWLAAVTGARRGELCGLRWTDLDTTTGTLLVERSIVQIGGDTIVKDTKTHQARRIALDMMTLQLLEQHRARLVAHAADSGKVTFTDDLPIFPGNQLEPLHPDTISKRYRAAADDNGIPGRLHDLRHFAATQMAADGVPIRTISGRLGHANPATTFNVYQHFLEASDQDAANSLARALEP